MFKKPFILMTIVLVVGLAGGISNAERIPIPAGFPNATNTGIAGVGLSVGDLTPVTAMTVTTEGAVVELLNISGGIRVSAANVTVRKCYITGGLYGVDCRDGYSGAVIEDCTITDGGERKAVCGRNMTVRRCDISGYQDGVFHYSNTRIEDCWIHDLTIGELTHNDCIQTSSEVGGNYNFDIVHNSLQTQYQDQTAAIIYQTHYGPLDDILIEDNFLSGGAYTVYCTDRGNGWGVPTNVTMQNNTWEKDSYAYGPLVYDGTPTFLCNKFHTGEWLSVNPPCDVNNVLPVADAGSDQTVVDTDENGSETVSLDGSGSYDTDGTIESYLWKEDGNQIATGVNPNVVFDVNYHDVTLEVTDNNSATDTDTVIIIVNTPTAVTSSSSWQNFSIDNQTGSFTFEFNTRPNNDNMDGVTGICKGNASAYSDLACIVRFNTSGNMDVRNGGIYDADATLAYSAGTNYHVRMEIDISSHIYDVYVTPEGQSEVTLADDYAFRTEQGSVTSLDRWAITRESGSHMVDNAGVTTGGDTTAPSPDPMTWATEPNATGTSSISMTATTATDESGVEYYFECTAGDGNNSGWQDSSTYEDTGLDANTTYSYKVKARDKSSNQNETAYSTVKSATTEAAASWTELTYDDFESGWGSYSDGGSDCRRYTGGTYAHQGSCAINIQDNSGVASSFYYTNGVDVNTPGYSQIKVEFWYYPRSMESGEDFWVQYYDGSQWHTVATFVSGTDFSNDSFYEVKDNDVVIDSSTYDFPTNMKIRFMCDASTNTDDIYIDEVKVSAKGGAAEPNGNDIYGDTADRCVEEDGYLRNVADTSGRVGGGSTDGHDWCLVYVFQLPTLQQGQTITAANLKFYYEGTSYYTPAGNVDLHGLDYRTSSSVQSGDFYQGSFTGDPDSTGTQDDIVTPSTSTGTINTDGSGDTALKNYLNAQYITGAEGGDYVFLRLNSDTNETNNPQRYYTFSSANHGTVNQRPVLTVTIE